MGMGPFFKSTPLLNSSDDSDGKGHHGPHHQRTSWRLAFRCRREVLIRTVVWFLIFGSLFSFYGFFSGYTGEIDVREEFAYPLHTPDFPKFVEEFRRSGSKDFPNKKYSSIEFLSLALKPEDYQTPHGLLIVVKSAVTNVEKRNSIRQTWGSEGYLAEAQLPPGHPTKVVFICGIPPDNKSDNFEALFPDWNNNDIVVADFADTYLNNTYKSILSLRWGSEKFPSDYGYMLLVDDDMYVDLFNLLAYLENFPKRKFAKHYNEDLYPNTKFPYYRQSTSFNKTGLVSGSAIIQDGLYLGLAYWYAPPFRQCLFHERSEWVVSLEEYPYNLYPPYIPGAAILFSKEAVNKISYASSFVKHFKIDDVFIGIIAQKIGLLVVHNPHFHSAYPSGGKLQTDDNQISEAIAIHGCECPAQMMDLWLNRNPLKLKKCEKVLKSI